MNVFLILNQSQTGPHTVGEVRQMIAAEQASEFTPAWHPGLVDWVTLGDLSEVADLFTKHARHPIGSTGPAEIQDLQFQQVDRGPIETSAKEYEIGFGSAFFSDQHGFLRSGRVRISTQYIVVRGYRLMPWLARLEVVGPIGVVLFGFLALILRSPEVLLVFLGPVGWIVGLSASLKFIRYFIAKQEVVRWERSQISKIHRSSGTMSFLAPLRESGKLRKVLFRAKDKIQAEEIERALAG